MKQFIYWFYSLLLSSFTIFSYTFVDQNLIYYKQIYSGFAFQNRIAVSLIYAAFIFLFFIIYACLIKLINKKILNLKDIKYLIGITCLILLFSYPAILSYDIFNYITTAKVLFYYHENPYLIMPIAFLGDPILLFTHAANKTALYGPAWLLISGIPFIFGLGNFFLTIINFKLVVLLFYLATVFMLWKFTKNILTVAFFAFNPLIVIETLVSGHNDIVMIFLALLSFYLLKNKRYLWAICLFLLSILIKYATGFLLPIFIFILWQMYHKKEINWEKTFIFSTFSMLIIFFLSPLREEMYPWYALWFLTFAFCVPKVKFLLYFSLAMSVGLLLRYLPFMYLGTYFGMTPVSRIILTLIPVIVFGLFYLTKLKRS